MSEMVERIARVLCGMSGRDPDRCEDSVLPGSGKLPPNWTFYIPNARAALMAIREPVTIGDDQDEAPQDALNAAQLAIDEFYNGDRKWAENWLANAYAINEALK